MLRDSWHACMTVVEMLLSGAAALQQSQMRNMLAAPGMHLQRLFHDHLRRVLARRG